MTPGEGALELVLWRHAEAEDGSPDQARRLTAHGARQAERMAGWLEKHLPRHYRVISSPAARAQQTAKALRTDFQTDKRIAVGARPADILAAVEWETADGAVVVVGHQPTLGRTAALLLCGVAHDWMVKKAGVWWLSRSSDGILLRAVMAPALV